MVGEPTLLLPLMPLLPKVFANNSPPPYPPDDDDDDSGGGGVGDNNKDDVDGGEEEDVEEVKGRCITILFSDCNCFKLLLFLLI